MMAFSDMMVMAGGEGAVYHFGWDVNDEQGRFEFGTHFGLGAPFFYIDFMARFSSASGGFLGIGLAGQIGFGG